MSPTLTIVILWLAFAATHIRLSSGAIRPRLVARLGAGPFLGLYSVVALALFVPLVSTYFAQQARRAAALVGVDHPALRWAIYSNDGARVSSDGRGPRPAEPLEPHTRRLAPRAARNGSRAIRCSWVSGCSASCT